MAAGNCMSCKMEAVLHLGSALSMLPHPNKNSAYLAMFATLERLTPIYLLA